MKYNKVARTAKSRGQALGIKVEPRIMMSSDVTEQVSENYEIILIDHSSHK